MHTPEAVRRMKIPVRAKTKRRQAVRRWSNRSLFATLATCAVGLTVWSLVGLVTDTTTTTSSITTIDAPRRDRDSSLRLHCQQFAGILLIQQGDQEGAAGTIFYLFVLNQLLYAERHHLLPWIHLNNASHWVYDETVHGTNNQTPSSQSLVTYWPGPWDANLVAGLDPVDQCPAAPPSMSSTEPRLAKWTLTGNGIWSSYYHPVTPLARSCLRVLPMLTLTPDQILHGLHLRCPWAVRAWRYGGTSQTVKRGDLSLQDWLGDNRRRGAAVVQRYYHWQPDMQSAIDALVAPWTSKHATGQEPQQFCLGLHIRHSDKGNRRRRIAVSEFWPYVQAWWNLVPSSSNAGHVYVATDSDDVWKEIRTTWPRNDYERNHLLHTQPHVWRSQNTSAVFALYESRHDETNRQVLLDIGALSHCSFLLHGHSAVSEAAVYHNVALHNRSVNLEDPRHVTVQRFEHMVRVFLETNKNL